jgi:hypothetical protein
MITINVGVEFGAYNVEYTAAFARWTTWPLDATVVVTLSPLGVELKVAFVVEDFKMEFHVIKL